MRKAKFYVGEGLKTEERFVTTRDVKRGYLRLRERAEMGSIIAGDIPILEYPNFKEEANNEKGTWNIGYEGMAKGDKLFIKYVSFKKKLICVASEMDIGIKRSMLPGDIDIFTSLDINMQDLKFTSKYSDYFLTHTEIPIVIIDHMDFDINPFKIFICGLNNCCISVGRHEFLFFPLQPLREVIDYNFSCGAQNVLEMRKGAYVLEMRKTESAKYQTDLVN